MAYRINPVPFINFPCNKYAIVFAAALNGLQVDYVNKVYDSLTSVYSNLVVSKLITACNARTQ